MRNLEQGAVLFSRYKIIDLIGSGGSSDVFLAENLRTGSLVAVKAVSKNGAKVNLIAEKDLLKGLRHSAIPTIVDICEDDDGLYLIEEYVEGTPLGSLKLQLDEKDIQDIMIQLCDVLLYLHTSCEEPIIYRDLKPDNIIRMNNGRIKLIDFGIAVKHSEMSDKPMVHYGTRGYAAPEQLSYSKADLRTDIYSLGVCMYYMLTGKNLSSPPYRLQPIRDVNPDISPEFAAIITKCIETLPAKRYQNAGHIVHDIRNIGKMREAEVDYLAFKEHGRTVITCAGIKRGMGATHMSFMVASYYRRQHLDVALVEWQKRDDLIKTASLYDHVEEDRYHYSLNGIDCYFQVGGCDYNKALQKVYDVIVIDAGSYEELMLRGSYELTDELLLVSGSKDWEVDYFEEAVFTDAGGVAKYLFNFTTDEVFARIRREMLGVQLYQVPYNPDPYRLDVPTIEVLCKVFGEAVQRNASTRKGVLDHAKAFFGQMLRPYSEK